MPTYQNVTPPLALSPGDSAQVWIPADGNLTSGTKTTRVALQQRPGGDPQKVSVTVNFGGAPGAITANLQTADDDVDAEYFNEGTAFPAVNAGNVTRLEVPLVAAKFARILFTTVTTPQAATVQIST